MQSKQLFKLLITGAIMANSFAVCQADIQKGWNGRNVTQTEPTKPKANVEQTGITSVVVVVKKKPGNELIALSNPDAQGNRFTQPLAKGEFELSFQGGKTIARQVEEGDQIIISTQGKPTSTTEQARANTVFGVGRMSPGGTVVWKGIGAPGKAHGF